MNKSVEPGGAHPLVSIVILNYKRREALEHSLGSALSQEYPNLEILLVDNGSNDGIRDYVRPHIPKVRLIELPWNLGACAGRNAGIREAHGSVIITLDNDIYFDSVYEVRKVVLMFKSRPDVHLLAFQLCGAVHASRRMSTAGFPALRP